MGEIRDGEDGIVVFIEQTRHLPTYNSRSLHFHLSATCLAMARPYKAGGEGGRDAGSPYDPPFPSPCLPDHWIRHGMALQ